MSPLKNQHEEVKNSVKKVLTLDTMNPYIREMNHLVRGSVENNANKIEKKPHKKAQEPPKDRIEASIGDCHAMGQKPITFIRQVLALLSYSELFQNPQFPDDAKERASEILKCCKGNSIGAYPDCFGIEMVRRHCADFIERRDGHPCDWQNIVLGSGASDCISGILELIKGHIEGKKPGVMVPIPQYPLYTSVLSEFNMHRIEYYLDETDSWSLKVSELQRSITEAKKVSHPRAIVIINPGNPTGQVLKRENIELIIKFAYEENLIILADEVYQQNIYGDGTKFHSFKKVMTEMGSPYSEMELFSFMSCSKGYMGECGIRGGYVEILNMDPEVQVSHLTSLCNVRCPSVLGQAVVDIICNPPKRGDPSFEQFMKETSQVLKALEVKAKMVEEAFSQIKGFNCNPVKGAMYAFPQVQLPLRAIQAAEEENKSPDAFYASRLLEETGICIVPGSVFGRIPGKYFFRTTILPREEDFKCMLDRISRFHDTFLATYS